MNLCTDMISLAVTEWKPCICSTSYCVPSEYINDRKENCLSCLPFSNATLWYLRYFL